jgi:hypothetical protein
VSAAQRGCASRTGIPERLRRHESLYYWANRTRHCTLVRRIEELPGRRHSRKLLASGAALTADVDAAMGLGGVLTWAARILELADHLDRPIALRFSAPTYRPSWPVEDWLDCYFDRRRPATRTDVIVRARYLPVSSGGITELAPRLWQHLTIRPDCVTAAQTIPFTSFAAVHYRGSDKYLEAPRVAYDAVLRRTESEMVTHGLDKLFVASDEEAFVKLAAARFGGDCWWLPAMAVAKGTRPAHFTDVPGEIKASEALTTMTLLARAQLCVRTPSLMSEWAMTLDGRRTVVLANR